jgi:protein tyrosine phosphatase (PTP) superfamily phosphohydrolase (DUF442 family)
MDAARITQLPEKPPQRQVALPRRRGVRLLLALAVGALLALAFEAGWVTAGANFHTVIPNQVYRSAQLSPATLREVAQRHGIRTVINLRGCCDDADWYHEQRACLEPIGVEQHDINFSSYFLPSWPELRALVRALDECERPLLIHCRRGSDRTGLASALALLLHTDADLTTARRQLAWRFGHVGLNRTDRLRRVFGMYEAWLCETGATHEPARLREYVTRHYRPGRCWAEIEPLEVPKHVPLGQRTLARFRVHNRSLEPWHLKQAHQTSVYLGYELLSSDWSMSKKGGAGYFDAIIAPGECVELAFALPALRTPGKYRLLVDMVEPKLGWFHQLGSSNFETELIVGVE